MLAGAASATMAAPPAAESEAQQPGAIISVIGTVQAGVEAGCKILVTTTSRPYLLLGGDPAVVRIGARLLVTGELRPDVATFCQQGIPLKVISAVPLP